MKNFILLLIISFVAACSFLEEEPQDFLSPANFYTTQDDAIAAVTAVYSYLSDGSHYGQAFWNLGEVPADLVSPGAGAPQARVELNEFDYDGTNGIINGFWNQLYTSINAANAAIERIPNIEMNEELRARLLGEAKFLRALNYFDLVRTFGDVPLTTSETVNLEDLNVSRTSAAEVYQQIINDLNEAEAVLPETYENAQEGRATLGAARALLARVYLYMGDYAMAAEKANEVLGMNYALLEDYTALWEPGNKNSAEHIFSVQYKSGVKGSFYNSQFAVRNAPVPINGNSAVIVEQAFYESFGPGDERRDPSVRTSYPLVINGQDSLFTFEPHVWKYFNESDANPGDTDTNWPVIRLSEIYLILAEALSEQNGGPTPEAYAAINTVRTRAGLENLPQGLNQEAFLEAVLQERAWELCFEGHRWYDLTRTNRLLEVMSEAGKNIEPRHVRYPLPQNELDVNPNLQQNEGYL